MKSLLLAALLFLGASTAHADNIIWLFSMHHPESGSHMEMTIDEYGTSILNKQACLKLATAVHGHLVLRDEVDNWVLKCTQP